MVMNARALHAFLACTGVLGLALMLLLANFTASENYTTAFVLAVMVVAFYGRVLGGYLPMDDRPRAGSEQHFIRGHQLIRWTNLVYYPVSVFPEVLAALLADKDFLAFHMLAFLLFPAALACWVIGLRFVWRSMERRKE